MEVFKPKLRSYSGFTLVELIILILVVGILARIVYLKLPSVPDMTVSAQASQLANDIRYARTLSMSSGINYSLSISGSSYQIKNSSDVPINFASGNTITNLGANITFNSISNLPQNLIAFNGRGVPYVDKAAKVSPLLQDATIKLKGQTQIISIIITPETGKVSVQ